MVKSRETGKIRDNLKMENNNNAPVPNENGSGSQDSFITDENSKDVVSQSAPGPTEGDDNLSPISDSELEDDATNDTTDARPVTPSPAAGEPVSLSNDDAESAKNDNEAAVAEKPSDTEDISQDVEMRDVDGDGEKTSDTAVTPSEADAEAVDRANNNSPSMQQPPVVEEPVESMDVDETDKAKVQSEVATTTTAATEETSPVDETSQPDPENESTNVSTADNQPATEEGHFQSVTGTESANVSISGNQPDTDMLNEANEATDTQEAGEDENAEQNVQEIEIGVFRDVTVTTELILTRTVYDKILEDTQKNISELEMSSGLHGV